MAGAFLAAGVKVTGCTVHYARLDVDDGPILAQEAVPVLAGFMRLVGPVFLERFPQRVVNTHPALSPSFPGMHAPSDALHHGVKVTGCTIFIVDDGVDTGPIVAQACVPVLEDDTVETLHERIKDVERRLYPAVLRDIVEREG